MHDPCVLRCGDAVRNGQEVMSFPGGFRQAYDMQNYTTTVRNAGSLRLRCLHAILIFSSIHTLAVLSRDTGVPHECGPAPLYPPQQRLPPRCRPRAAHPGAKASGKPCCAAGFENES